MKSLSIISIFTLLLGSINKDCVIREKGLNNLVLDYSELNEVTTEFGEMEKGKEWQKPVGWELFGNYRYYKIFQKQGIAFYAGRERGKKIINDIVLTDGCICKTEKGIGIGRSYQELSKAFGQPYFNNEERKPSSSYEPNMYFDVYNGKRTLQITYNNYYITMSSTDTTISRIQKIRLL